MPLGFRGRKKEEETQEYTGPPTYVIKGIGTGESSEYAKKIPEVREEMKRNPEKYKHFALFRMGEDSIAMQEIGFSPKEVQYNPKTHTLTLSRSIVDQIRSDEKKLKEKFEKYFGIEEITLTEKIEKIWEENKPKSKES